MFLTSLDLHNFRNYVDLSIEHFSRYNIITGNNAQGKSNFLESIYFLCLAKSFRRNPDENLVTFDQEFFEINGNFTFSTGAEKKTRIWYAANKGKYITINKRTVVNRSELLGTFPVVLLSAEDYKITIGAPSERRRFIDILLCQSSISYLDDLKRYTSIIKQRNALLKSGDKADIRAQLAAWDEHLLRYGCRLMMSRKKMIDVLAVYLEKKFKTLTDERDIFKISYEPSVNWETDPERSFRKRLDAVREREIMLGMTIVGPHRDTFSLHINGNDVRYFGSQGEQKSVILALRLAEYEILYRKKEETPILLFDDLSVDLDNNRLKNIHLLLPQQAQFFITSTSSSFVKVLNLGENEGTHFEVQSGAILKVT